MSPRSTSPVMLPLLSKRDVHECGLSKSKTDIIQPDHVLSFHGMAKPYSPHENHGTEEIGCLCAQISIFPSDTKRALNVRLRFPSELIINEWWYLFSKLHKITRAVIRKSDLLYYAHVYW